VSGDPGFQFVRHGGELDAWNGGVEKRGQDGIHPAPNLLGRHAEEPRQGHDGAEAGRLNGRRAHDALDVLLEFAQH
jgi:hypothetical protein